MEGDLGVQPLNSVDTSIALEKEVVQASWRSVQDSGAEAMQVESLSQSSSSKWRFSPCGTLQLRIPEISLLAWNSTSLIHFSKTVLLVPLAVPVLAKKHPNS